MPTKQNPAKLNPLQLRTLTLLQAIARIPGASNRLPEVTVIPGPTGEAEAATVART